MIRFILTVILVFFFAGNGYGMGWFGGGHQEAGNAPKAAASAGNNTTGKNGGSNGGNWAGNGSHLNPAGGMNSGFVIYSVGDPFPLSEPPLLVLLTSSALLIWVWRKRAHFVFLKNRKKR